MLGSDLPGVGVGGWRVAWGKVMAKMQIPWLRPDPPIRGLGGWVGPGDSHFLQAAQVRAMPIEGWERPLGGACSL